MSGLQGLMGGFGGFPGGMAPPAGLGASGLQGSPMPSLGMDFGRGLAAGASAAGAVPPVTQAPMTSLVAPVETAPTSAAPAAAPVAAAPLAAASAPAPAPRCAGGWFDAVWVGASSAGHVGVHRRLVRHRRRCRFLLRPVAGRQGRGRGLG